MPVTRAVAGQGIRMTGFGTGAVTQTFVNPQMTLGNLGREMGQDIHVDQNPKTGNMIYSVDGMELVGDVSKAYAYAVSEFGTERMGEVMAATKLYRRGASFFNISRRLNQGKGIDAFRKSAARAGYHGVFPELMEESFNEFSTYLYDLSTGEEDFSWETLDRRFTTPEEGDYWLWSQPSPFSGLA